VELLYSEDAVVSTTTFLRHVHQPTFSLLFIHACAGFARRETGRGDQALSTLAVQCPELFILVA
jgi:hypothetical protein